MPFKNLTLEKASPFIIAAVLALAVLWLQYARLGDDGDVPARDPAAPDFMADGILAVQYDVNGRLQYRLEAQRMTHFPGEAYSILQQPRLRWSARDEHATLRADLGKAFEKQHNLRPEAKLLLGGQVQVERRRGQGEPLRLHTEALAIWPESERMQSTAPVRIVQGVQQARANTLAASHLFGTLELAGNARMTLPPDAVSN